MLLGGDELGRTQQGNNNAYCQDNELSWYDWGAVDEELLEFTRRLVAYRQAHPLFRRRRFFHGRPIRTPGGGEALPDIVWFGPDGAEMGDEQWESGEDQTLTVFLNGDLVEHDRRGEPVVDDRLLLVLNGDPEQVDVTLPPPPYAASWAVDVDTETGAIGDGDSEVRFAAGAVVEVPGRCVLVLRAVDG
jgi:glycogen operon protein